MTRRALGRLARMSGLSIATAASAAEGTTSSSAALAAPASLRGAVELGSLSGLVTGALDDRPGATAIRIANGSILQAGLDAAAGAGKFVEESNGLRIEYSASRAQEARNVGLQIPYDLRGFLGSGPAYKGGSRLIQYASNHPAITLGDVGSGDKLSEGCTYRGFRIGYGIGQQGQDQASTILIGRGFACRYEDLFEDSYMAGTLPCQGMTGLHFYTANGQFTFSNILKNIKIHRAQRNLLRTGAVGTGNVWENVYLGGGTFGSRVPLSGAAVHFANNWASQAAGAISQLNIEWVEANRFLFLEAVRSGSFDSLRFEGCKLIGQSPSLIHAAGSNVSIHALASIDNWVDAAAKAPSLISANLDSMIRIDGLEAKWSGTSYNPEAVIGTHTSLVKADQGHHNIEVANATFEGGSDQFELDASLGAGVFTIPPRIGRYRYRSGQSQVVGGLVSLVDQDYASYGAHLDVTIRYSGKLTAKRTVTISPICAPSGLGSVLPRPEGDVIRIVRDDSAAGAFPLAVQDHAGAQIAQLDTPGTELVLAWRGGRAVKGAT